MTFRESDGRIVPQQPEDDSGGEKPSNTGVGKAARISRGSDRASPVLRDGPAMLTRLDRLIMDLRRTTVFGTSIAAWRIPTSITAFVGMDRSDSR